MRHLREAPGVGAILAGLALTIAACTAQSAQAPSSRIQPTGTTAARQNRSTAATTDPAPVSIEDVRAPSAMPAGPEVPGPSVSGVQSPKTSDPLDDAVYSAWQSMVWSLYSHHDAVNAATGFYQFDCVGATNYFLSVADPNANKALRTAEHVARHFVPTPVQVARYFASLPTRGTSSWRPVVMASQIGPGEIIAVPPAPRTNEPGHAMMTAGPAVPLNDGDFAVLVFDSTAAPGHGTLDSRRWDTRDLPLPNVPGKPPDRKSGLGYGTVEVTVSPGGAPQGMLWEVGGSRYGGTIEVARPLS